MKNRSNIDLENSENLSSLLRLYKQTGDIETRNKIIEICYPMVDYILNIDKFKDFQDDRDILASYGYEGLFMAVTKNKSCDLKTFRFNTYHLIYRYIMHGISEITGLSVNFFWKLHSANKERESMYGESIEDNLSILNKVLDDLVREGKLAKELKKAYYKKILLSPKEIEDISNNLTDSNLVVSEDMDQDIFLKQLHNYLMYLMDNYCTEEQKNTLMKRFGFDGEPLTYMEISNSRTKAATQCSIRRGIYNLRKGLWKERYLLNHNLKEETFCSPDELSSCLLSYLNEPDRELAKRKVKK